MEALLETHPRTEVVVLAYDLHIPRPDPLTSPDTVARADWLKISSTPSYVLDGKKLGSFGALRDGADEIYGKLVKTVDDQAAKASSVQLRLTASTASGGNITTQAIVTLADAASLSAPTLAAQAPDPADKKAKPEKKPSTPAPAPAVAGVAAAPKYILNFALVEDDVRYSGENGIRFHRMVVRGLAKPSGVGFPLETGKSLTLDATFDPAAIAQASREYLEGYEKTNDRFGPVEFLSKDTTMQPQHLAIAAWVQEVSTHRVLQSAFLPLGGEMAGTR